MKILVCISHVPDTTSRIKFADGNSKLDNTGVQFVINPNDEYSLTRAMWFKEKQGATVHIINVGGPETEPTLRKALAIGADEAIRINVEATDGYSVAKQIAAVAKEGAYDLIMGGRESIDYNGGMVPGMLAKMLDYNFVNTCINLEIEGSTATATRELDSGTETIKTDLPLVVGGQKGIVEESDLRIPNMRGIMQARQKPLSVKEPVSTSAETQTIKFEEPAPKGAVKIAETVDQLIDLLHNDAKVI